jgi:opacity protein-like surface antigen
MAVTTSPRLGLTRWSAGTDPFTRAQQDATHAALEANAAMYAQGTLGSRPAAGKAGRFYFATDIGGVLYYDDGTNWQVTSEATYVWGSEGTLTAPKTGKGRILFPVASVIMGVWATDDTAPTGAAILLDVNKNGTTIFSTQGNRPTIAIAANATAAEVTNMNTTAISADQYLTIDIDQIGSTVAGADLTVGVRVRRAA